jgi:hypothetical protein
VLARPDSSGNHRLLAYVVPRPGATAEVAALRSHVQQRLPEYMVPSAITVLDKFPLTANGKLDRRALPEPEFNHPVAEAAAPRSATEELLAEIWCAVLALKQVGIHDNFFELGGHSLLATQVITRVHDALNVELTLRQFFIAPTIARMAPVIEDALLADIQAGTADDAARSAGELATIKE